jgi:hypothetical protein
VSTCEGERDTVTYITLYGDCCRNKGVEGWLGELESKPLDYI